MVSERIEDPRSSASAEVSIGDSVLVSAVTRLEAVASLSVASVDADVAVGLVASRLAIDDSPGGESWGRVSAVARLKEKLSDAGS